MNTHLPGKEVTMDTHIVYRLDGVEINKHYMHDNPIREVRELYGITISDVTTNWHCGCESVRELNIEWFGGWLGAYRHWEGAMMRTYTVTKVYRCPDTHQVVFFDEDVVEVKDIPVE